MIKIDELLIPISRCVNQVYKILYPGYPCNPCFSMLRFFVNTWQKEVYRPLQPMVEQALVGFLKSFHQGCKEYSRDQKLTQKCTRNKMSLSDYFPSKSAQSPLVGPPHAQSVSPMLKSINLMKTPKQKQTK